jgi:hypothetical protein
MTEHDDEREAEGNAAAAAMIETGAPRVHEGELQPRGKKLLQRRYNLATLDGVRKEMGAIYKKSRDGKIDSALGSKLVWQLAQIGRILEIVEIERRLARLEELAASRR